MSGLGARGVGLRDARTGRGGLSSTHSPRSSTVPSTATSRSPSISRASSYGQLALGSELHGAERLGSALRATTKGQATAVYENVLDYILSGPLLKSCGMSEKDVVADADKWVELGERIAEQLDFPAFEQQDDVQKLRIYHYYLPVFMHLDRQLKVHKSSGDTKPLVVGISAPQGCGKTTVVEQLEQLFAYTGVKAASVSIDDFYLTYEDQCAVAADNEGNRLLQLRGNAGSHDMALGTATLEKLKACDAPGITVGLPRYDKSAFSGRGTRAEESAWPTVDGPLDVVLFEGWMLGFAPVKDADAAAIDEQLVPVNAALREYKAAWDAFVDSWLVIKIQDPQCVFQWRLQAEVAMRATGKSGMTDEQVADFVDRFMPAYQAYLPGLYGEGPTTAQPGKTLIIEVDAKRSPVTQQPVPIV